MARSNFRNLVAVCLASSCLTGIAASAAAQQIEEIVVTTRKRAENLQDVPIVITAFTAETMARKGIASLEDITKFTPGMTLEEGFSKQDTRITIRGLSPSRGRQNAAVLIDDVDISSEAIDTAGGSLFINPRLFDIERVEVVKGPHSALYGRSAFAGAINYITKKPSDEIRLNASAEIANPGVLEGRVSASGPVVAGKLALGGSLAIWHSNGFYDNSITGRNLGGNDGHGASVSGVFTPNDMLKFTIRSEYSDDHFDPEARTFVAPFATSLSLPAAAVTAGIPGIGATATVTAVLGRIPDAARLPLPRLSTNPRTPGLDYPGDDRKLRSFSLRGDAEFSMASLVSLTYLSDNDLTQFHDAIGYGDVSVTNALQETHFITNNKLISQDLRLQSNDEDGPLSWTVGGLFWNEVTRQEGRPVACIALPGGCVPILSTLGINRPFFSPGPNQDVRDSHHYSIYGLAEYAVTDALKLSIEVRHVWESEHAASTVNNTIVGCNGGQRTQAPPPLRCLVPGPQVQTPSVVVYRDGTTLRGLQTKSQFTTPRFTAEYKFADAGMVYASAGKGQKPGGTLSLLAPTVINVGGVPDTADFGNTRFLEERLWVYELGLKSDWLDGRLRTNADVYYQDFKYKQETGTRVGNDGLPVPGPANAEKARVIGFELDATAALTDSLTFAAGYTYIDAIYKKFVAQQTTAGNIALGGNCTVARPTVGTPFCLVDYSGKRLGLAPKHSFNISAELKQPAFGDADWFIEADTRYVGRRFTTFDNSTILNSFFTLDLRAGLSTDKWQLTAYVNNATNNDALKAGSVSSPAFPFSFLIPTFPGVNSGFVANLPDKRQFGLRASYTY